MFATFPLALGAAIASGLSFALSQVFLQKLANRGLNPLTISACTAWLLPLWLGLLVTTTATGVLSYNLTPAALAWPLTWAVLSALTGTGLVWLLARFSLSEVAGYKKAFITLGALLSDVVIFHQPYAPAKLLAVLLLLAGAVLLSRSRNRLPTTREFTLILLWCALLTLQITVYKKGQPLQPSVFSYTLLTQAMVCTLLLSLWLVPAVKNIPLPSPGLLRKNLLPALALLALAVGVEGFAYAGLPLAVLLVVTTLPAALFATHDLWHGHLARSPRTLLALALIAAGFLALILQ